jgi:NAD(P)-dependent dehydrogenase (short-subunit alcohol dehydrogenase family)
LKTVVISGGNGGLKRAMAKQFEGQGWHCVLMDVNIMGLKASDTRTPIAVDLTDRMALECAASHVITTRPSIDMVIYNAGVSQITQFAKSDPESHRRVFDINYFAAVEMVPQFLNPIRKSGGTHLAISSVAGFAPLYGRTAYAAPKRAMQGFFSSLRSEEGAFGVRCLIAAPSFIATNIGNAECTDDGIMRPGAAKDGIDYMTPEAAAKVILRSALKGKEFIPVGRVALLASLLMRVSPKLYQWSMRRNMRTEKTNK